MDLMDLGCSFALEVVGATPDLLLDGLRITSVRPPEIKRFYPPGPKLVTASVILRPAQVRFAASRRWRKPDGRVLRW
jgi:hypothetical protein